MLDSRVVNRVQGANLVLGVVEKDPNNPLFREDKPWEPRFDNLYANVIYDQDEKLYRCWYSPFTIDELASKTPREKRKTMPYRSTTREMGICYAFSKDGITWEKPELGLVEFQGSTQNNIVWRGPHGSGVMKDPLDPDPARRFKMIGKIDDLVQVGFSPDGLRWPDAIPAEEIQAAADTHNNAFWSPELGRYVGITRLWDNALSPGIRVVGRTESADFTRWTKAVEVFRALPEEPHRQIYAMPVFRYAGVYLGLPMLLNTDTDVVDCELAWSADTVNWHRVCPGTSFIPRGPDGSYDSGCVYAAAYPVFEENEIKIYYGGNNDTHMSWRDGFFCLARLRPDGFAGFEQASSDKPGLVATHYITCVGSKLQISADAREGSVRVSVLGQKGLGLNECEPVSGNVIDRGVSWRDGKDLSALIGQQICLRFELKNARLYAFGFADE
ncbi:MAG: hypothetical protein ABIH23_31495 [bacterium]